MQARLDRLDADARELITTAAVIGRSFGASAARAAPAARAASADALRAPVAPARGRGAAAEPRASTASGTGLSRRSPTRRSSRRDRRELHLRVGEALGELHRDSPAEVYGLLAHHFAEADEPERAVEYLLKAGDAARAAYAEDEAIELYRRALAFMERIGDEARARQTLLRIALTHHLAFDYHAANEAFARGVRPARPRAARLEPSERHHLGADRGLARGPAGAGFRTYELADWVTVNLFRGLVAVGRDVEIEPDLAERFTVSDDGRLYRFTLRADARWSDGMPVTADDFAFTFARMVEDDWSRGRGSTGVTARALDERTLELELDEPRNHFLYLLGRPWLFPWPRHVYEHAARLVQDIPLVGNGPFVLTERNAHADGLSGNMTLDAAPAWYGARGNIGRVTMAVESSHAEVGDRWRAGVYDLVDDFLAMAAAIDADDSTIVEQDTSAFTAYLGLAARVLRSTMPASVAHSRTRSTGGGCRRSPGSHRRVRAACFRRRSRPLPSRRSAVRPGSCPCPAQCRGLPRRAWPCSRSRWHIWLTRSRGRPASPASSEPSAYRTGWSPARQIRR